MSAIRAADSTQYRSFSANQTDRQTVRQTSCMHAITKLLSRLVYLVCGSAISIRSMIQT